MPIDFFRCILIGACLVLLVACGNKGALVMPQKPIDVPVQPLPPTEAKSQDDKEASQPAIAKPAQHR
ncbi:hypothetical protein AF72_09910 [Xylella taiwanensis]|nr:hypothetical protein AF72_09910 [Xylella taiwanensis]